MKRELSRLGEGCHEQERGDAEVERVSGERAPADELRQLRGASHLYQKKRRRQKREPSTAGDEQRLCCRSTCLGSLVIEPDQEVRREAGELPEDEECDEVVTQDDPEHRA